MEYFVAMAVAVILEALSNRKTLLQIAVKLAHVYVAIEREAEDSPMLRAAIERERREA